jgi:4-hydroxyphenylpyruvate dioxygenase-like putative hemolysin
LLIFLFFLEPIYATPALTEQVQDGEFSNRLKVTGTGTFEVGVSVKDRQLALEYENFMYGDGDLEMDTGTVEAQRAAYLFWQDSHGGNEVYQLQVLLGRHRRRDHGNILSHRDGKGGKQLLRLDQPGILFDRSQ